MFSWVENRLLAKGLKYWPPSCIVWVPPLPCPVGGYGDFNILNNGGGGGWKILTFNRWVMYNGRVDLKMGGGWELMPPLTKRIPELAQHFLLHFHACSFSNNSYAWISFFMWCIYILSLKLVTNWSNWLKALLNFFVFLCFEL